MKKEFSKNWNKSVQPRKQRKYRYNAPLHTKGKFLSVNLTKKLREKHSTRNVRVRTGDKVRVTRGDHKTKEGKVSKVNVKQGLVYVEGVENTRKDGSTSTVPLKPSNLQITDLDLSDKKRKERLQKEN